MVKLDASDQKKLVSHLQKTTLAIEEWLTAGLTSANESSFNVLRVAFQEAARLKLLRLSGTLRNTHDEVNRFVQDDPRFSQKRLVFFLNRCWLMARGMIQAIENDNVEQLNRLLWTPATRKRKSISVVCLGAIKKIALGSYCTFEFRLRAVKTNESLTWSVVFPMKPDVEIPAEGYLHLPQKQKFTANCFLKKKVAHIFMILTK